MNGRWHDEKVNGVDLEVPSMVEAADGSLWLSTISSGVSRHLRIPLLISGERRTCTRAESQRACPKS
jgi:hypothetical protein